MVYSKYGAYLGIILFLYLSWNSVSVLHIRVAHQDSAGVRRHAEGCGVRWALQRQGDCWRKDQGASAECHHHTASCIQVDVLIVNIIHVIVNILNILNDFIMSTAVVQCHRSELSKSCIVHTRSMYSIKWLHHSLTSKLSRSCTDSFMITRYQIYYFSW